jgi:glucose/arabinose dehydrogenase
MVQSARKKFALVLLIVFVLVDIGFGLWYLNRRSEFVETHTCPTTRLSDVPTLGEVADWPGSPIALASIGDVPSATSLEQIGPDRFLVTSQLGRVWLVSSGTEEVVVDLSGFVSVSEEQGLLDVVAYEDLILLSYTDVAGDVAVISYAVGYDGLPTGEPVLEFKVPQPHEWHNSGNLEVSPEGDVYISLGDGGGEWDEYGNGQDPTTVLGAVSRFTPRHGRGEVKLEVVAFGLRNPWQIGFDGRTGDLWIADVGQFCVEEINVVPAGSDLLNFGWPALEGSWQRDAEVPPGSKTPLFEYRHDDGHCSISGGHVYRGSKIPELEGSYIFSDYCEGSIYALELDDGLVVGVFDLGVSLSLPTAINEGSDGELYVLSINDGVQQLTLAP